MAGVGAVRDHALPDGAAVRSGGDAHPAVGRDGFRRAARAAGSGGREGESEPFEELVPRRWRSPRSGRWRGEIHAQAMSANRALRRACQPAGDSPADPDGRAQAQPGLQRESQCCAAPRARRRSRRAASTTRLSGRMRCANRIAAPSVRGPRAEVTTTANGGVVRCQDSSSPAAARPRRRAACRGVASACEQIGDAHTAARRDPGGDVERAHAVDRPAGVGRSAARACVGDRPSLRKRRRARGNRQCEARQHREGDPPHAGRVGCPSAARKTARTISSGALSLVT